MDKMWWNLLYSLMERGGAIISVFMLILLFAYLYGGLLPANAGTVMGIGVGGCIGMVGIAFGHLGLLIGIALGGTLRGLIGNGIHGLIGMHLQGIREAEQRVFDQQQELNQRRMLDAIGW